MHLLEFERSKLGDGLADLVLILGAAQHAEGGGAVVREVVAWIPLQRPFFAGYMPMTGLRSCETCACSILR